MCSFFSDERSAGFTDGWHKEFYIQSCIVFLWWAKLWSRKLLLERLERLISDFNVMFFKTRVSGSVRPLMYGKIMGALHG